MLIREEQGTAGDLEDANDEEVEPSEKVRSAVADEDVDGRKSKDCIDGEEGHGERVLASHDVTGERLLSWILMFVEAVMMMMMMMMTMLFRQLEAELEWNIQNRYILVTSEEIDIVDRSFLLGKTSDGA